VYQSGQYAIRGSVIDLYPSGSSTPYRLDLFDEEIESIRVFDAESQRSTGRVERIGLLPAREYPCDEASLESFRRAFRMRFEVDTRRVTLYQDLRAGVLPQGLEQYLPLFHPQTSFLLDYLQQQPMLVLQDGVFEAAEDLDRRTRERWEQRRYDVERPVLEPDELFFAPTELRSRLESCRSIRLHGPEQAAEPAVRFASEAAPDLHIHERGREPALALQQFVEAFPGRVLFAADTTGRREVLRSTLAAFGLSPEGFEDFAAFSVGSASAWWSCRSRKVSWCPAMLSRGWPSLPNRSCSAAAVGPRRSAGQRAATGSGIRNRSSVTSPTWQPAPRWSMKTTAWDVTSDCRRLKSTVVPPSS